MKKLIRNLTPEPQELHGEPNKGRILGAAYTGADRLEVDDIAEEDVRRLGNRISVTDIQPAPAKEVKDETRQSPPAPPAKPSPSQAAPSGETNGK